MNSVGSLIARLAEEPPFRLLTRIGVRTVAISVRTKARWDVSPRPQYLAGVLAAADQALKEGVAEISVFEFGVARGNGLLALGDIAAEVERETGVRIRAYGFDTGRGLPELTGDYRDHPDQWQAGDYPMDEDRLRRKLRPNTTLVIGNIRETLGRQLAQIDAKIGFVAVDVDAYSSTCHVLDMFLLPNRRMLRRVFMYFDDIDWIFNHQFAGELLAIDEFNTRSRDVKIDRWRNVARQRPFPEESWLKRMYIAHDLAAISEVHTSRTAKLIPVKK